MFDQNYPQNRGFAADYVTVAIYVVVVKVVYKLWPPRK